jgi:glycosyltransferase involved in cell wall biosynthesis
MDSKFFVNFVLPIFNESKFYYNCIDSLLSLDLDFQIIIVIDGSLEKSSYETVYKFKSLYPDVIKIIITENLGLANARNVGIEFLLDENRLGENLFQLVSFIDQDDFWTKKDINDFFLQISKDPCTSSFYFSACEIIPMGYKWAHNNFSNEFFNVFSNCYPYALAVPLNAFEQGLRYRTNPVRPIEWFEDWDFNLRLINWGYKPVRIENTLFKYRKKGSSLMTRVEVNADLIKADRIKSNPKIYNMDYLVTLASQFISSVEDFEQLVHFNNIFKFPVFTDSSWIRVEGATSPRKILILQDGFCNGGAQFYFAPYLKIFKENGFIVDFVVDDPSISARFSPRYIYNLNLDSSEDLELLTMLVSDYDFIIFNNYRHTYTFLPIIKNYTNAEVILMCHSIWWRESGVPEGYVPEVSWNFNQYIDRYLTVSEELRQIINSFGVSIDKITRIGSLPLFSRDPKSKFQISHETFNIGFVGRPSYEKGFDLFEAIAYEFKSEAQIKFFHIHKKSNARETVSLENINNSLYYDDDYNFTEVWNNLDLLLIPSRAEGTPLVLYDAAQFGVPVLATDVGELVELYRTLDLNGEIFNVNGKKDIDIINLFLSTIREYASGLRDSSKKVNNYSEFVSSNRKVLLEVFNV